MWHRNYKNTEAKKTIDQTFKEFMGYLNEKGYLVIFIPQLFGEKSDKEYMGSFAGENCFVMSDEMDSYFQQYVISKLYAVVGMRYHSNIFSAKMGVPFVSVAYEQKMEGFMKNTGLEKYCIKIEQLSFERLRNTFENMVRNYDFYKEELEKKRIKFQKKAYMTTQIIVNDIVKKVGTKK